ncbi:MAG: ABC transporter permease [Steroidobacteraceae bacterium]
MGANPTRQLSLQPAAIGAGFHDQQSQLAFYGEFGSSVRSLPGIETAGVASELPFVGGSDGYRVAGVGGTRDRSATSIIEFVDGHALSALQPALLEGRLIDSADLGAKAPVAVIDARLARFLFGTARAVGREIKMTHTYRVIGVTAPLLWRAHLSSSTPGTMWLPYSVAPADPAFYAGPDMDVAVRSSLPVATLQRELVTLLHKLAPQQAFDVVESMRVIKQSAYHDDQAMPVLFSLFSLLALVLAAAGTYGTVAYLFRLRIGEFAIRQAVGATQTRIGLLALAQGAILAALGVALGLIAGFLLARALSGMIAGANGTSAWAYVFAALVMSLAALGATAIPALRATQANLAVLLQAQ